MQTTKIIAISVFGILLSACDPNQMQVEGSSGADKLGKKHSHEVQGVLKPFIHQHGGDNSPTHTHPYSEIIKQL
jgi:hypothetical protein